MVRLAEDQARVTFIVRCETGYGQRLRIVGDHVDLGGWDPLRGPELTTSNSDFPKWSLTMTLPASRRYSYKYVCVAPSVLEQEPGANLQASDPLPQISDPLPPIQPQTIPPQPIQPQLSVRLGDAAVTSIEPQVEAIWEPFDDNRIVTTESRATIVVDDGTFSTVNNEIEGRVRTVSQVLSSRPSRDSDVDSDSRHTGNMSPSLAMPNDADSLIIAIYRLPIIAERDAKTGRWSFSWDDDALYLTSTGLRRGLGQLHIKPLWIGILNTSTPVPVKERDGVTSTLREKFNCVPVYIRQDVLTKFYQGFCKGVLWKPFHMLTNAHDADGKTLKFDHEAWHVYQRVNREFSKIIVAHYERHLIWVHDYHLMMLPYYLRIRLSGVRIGFYLHIPWPSSEIFRMLPVRNELLKGLLSATMLGFHLFDYARHFLSGCVRLLDLEHQAKRGSLGIEYMGRHVMIRVSHIGVDPERFSHRLGVPRVRQMAAEYEAMYPSKTVFGAIDDLDYIKGIALKLIAFEHYLKLASDKVRNNVALIQVALPKAARVDNSVRDEIRELVERINSTYGTEDHQPVLYIEKTISFDERIAIYSVCDALFLTPVRDGLNLIPYEYIVSTPQGKGQMILSEFTGCSRALSSAVRVNPWDVEQVRDVVDNVVQKREARASEIRLKHEADRKYVTAHSSTTWAESFLRDLSEASENIQEVVRLGLSRAGGFRRLEFDTFTMLNSRTVLKAFRESKSRLFLFDYDGTLTHIESTSGSSHMAHTWARPSEELRKNLELLSKQEGCTVVILSGRGVDTEGFHMQEMKSLGIAAEHGFYYKRPNSTKWEELAPEADLEWIEVALRIMQLYTDRTDGSYIEEKTAGLVWHYLAADPEFGQWQAKEMHDHLEGILTPFSVQVVSGHGWLQARMAGVNKGQMVTKVLEELGESPEFVLCCGDDRTDEDMFQVLEEDQKKQSIIAAAAGGDGVETKQKLFTATVGVKPSNARYYLRSSIEVASLIEGFVEVSLPGSGTHVRSSTFDDMRTAQTFGTRPLGDDGGGGGNGMGGLVGMGMRMGVSASSGSLAALDRMEGEDETEAGND